MKVFSAVLIMLLAAGIGALATGSDDESASDAVTASPTPSATESQSASRGPSPDPEPSRRAPTLRDPGLAPVGFSEDTETVLVFDDGYEGGLALDLDSGDQESVELPGQRAGDQPYRLHQMGSWLVVGWGEIFAVAPGSDHPPRSLGDATIFVPAAEPDQLWLVDYASGSIGGEFAATLIDASGTQLASVAMGGELQPLRGVPGGLALRRPSGALAIYDLQEGRVRDYLSDGEAASVADATRDRVLWCEGGSCGPLRVSTGAEQAVSTIGDEEQFSLDQVWFSPDGSMVGAVVSVPVGRSAVDRRLRIYSADTGTRIADAQVPLGNVHGEWTQDGTQFFAWLSSPGAGGGPALLGRWAGGDEVELVDVSRLGLVGMHSFVTFPRSAATEVFAPGGVGEACPVSVRSEAMGPLPAWRGDSIHIALPREAPKDTPRQLWVGIPDAEPSTSFTLSAERLDGPGLARFALSSTADRETVLEVDSGMRTASGYPPHWGLDAEISDPGCWAIGVATAGGVAETIVIDIEFDR